MGRRGPKPLGQRAMTSAERQRRYMARLRQRATPAPQPPSMAPDGATILAALRYLAMDPGPTANAMCGIIGDQATRAFRDALTTALTNHAVVSPANTHRNDDDDYDYDRYDDDE